MTAFLAALFTSPLYVCLSAVPLSVLLVASLPPAWRRGAWLRLQVAWLRLSAGRDLKYLAYDYGPPGAPEAPFALPRRDDGLDERLCHLCEDHRMDALRAAEIGRLKDVRAELSELAEGVRAEKAVACDAEAAADFAGRQIAELERDVHRAALRRSVVINEKTYEAARRSLRPYEQHAQWRARGFRDGYSSPPRVTPLDAPFRDADGD